jgi:hypothetical protein
MKRAHRNLIENTKFKIAYIILYIRYIILDSLYNIKMDLQEVGGSYGDWMELAQDRDRWRALVGKARNLRVPEMRGIS